MFHLMFLIRRVSRMMLAPLLITGPRTVAPLPEEIGKRFESLHRGTRADVQTGGSSPGIHDARRPSRVNSVIARGAFHAKHTSAPLGANRHAGLEAGRAIVFGFHGAIVPIVCSPILDIRPWLAVRHG
jgi:hypothetical protein